MLVETDTLSETSAEEVPGLVLAFSQGTALALPVPLDMGPMELGRDHPLMSSLTDPHLSRRHFRIACEDGRFLVTDLGSRNGTLVDGVGLRPGPPREVRRVIRAGDTLLLPVRDVGRMMSGVDVAGDRVVGPAQRQSIQAVRHAAGLGKTVQIIGEGGAGKEALARAYHAAGPAPGGPFQVVRCAALPEDELDQVVLGAGGYIHAAHGGTVLLDGVARLSDLAQAKLLHLLARGELLPFGRARPEPIDVRIAFTTRTDLRAEVEAGTLLEDLYYRLAAPRVVIPPLRDRPEEIPFLLARESARTVPGSSVEAALVEACLLCPWPGNVREIRAEARNAAQAAHLAGASSVALRFLDPAAGSARQPVKKAASAPASVDPLPANAAQLRERIVSTLALYEGNVARTAKALGVHRTQLRRWMKRFGMISEV